MQTVETPVVGAAAAVPATVAVPAPTPRAYVSFEYVCKFCFKTFKSGHALGGHQNIHRNDEYREVGKYCGLTFGFEDRKRRAAAVAAEAAASPDRRRPRVQRRREPNPRGGPARAVAPDSILAMARPRLNNLQGPRPRSPGASPMVHPGSTGTETGPGAVYEPIGVPGLNQAPMLLHPAPGDDVLRAWARLDLQGAPIEPRHSDVGDNFSDDGLSHGASLRINPGGRQENLILSVNPEAGEPQGRAIMAPPPSPAAEAGRYHPYGGFLEDGLGGRRRKVRVHKREGHTCSAGTATSESGSVEISSQPKDGVDLELKL